MKKLLPYILLLLAIVGCSKNSETTINKAEGKEMQFKISLPDVDTRAAIINSRDDMDGMSVGFYAFMTTSDIPITNELRAENVKLTYSKSAGAWLYEDGTDPIKWDFDYTYDKFSFYVYYPYDENAANIHFDYTLNQESFAIDYNAITHKDSDVMIAELKDIVCPSGGVINIEMKHILSAIRFDTDYSNPIEDVKLCSASNYTTMPMSGTASLSNGTVEWENLNNYTAGYSYSLGNKSGNYALIIPQTIQNKGDLYFSMSYSDGKTPVDNDAHIPAQMKLDAGQIYTFKYKGSYVDYEQESGDFTIDIDGYNASGAGYNDFSTIGEVIDRVNADAQAKDKEITLVVTGDLKDDDQAYHMLRYIVEGIIPNTWPQQYRENLEVHNFDFSKMNMETGDKFPYRVFDDKKIRNSLKTIKFPVMADDNFDAAFLDNCTELETVEFAEGTTITKLLHQFCYGCTSLKNINLDVLTSLTEVSQQAFSGCTALEEVKLPQSVTTISDQAFQNCTSFSQINIPASVKKIGWISFKNCTSLYSYEHDDIKAGFILEPRPDDSLIELGYQSFSQTNVQSLINNEKWWGGNSSDIDIFSTPQ